jgi:hypothetical protein
MTQYDAFLLRVWRSGMGDEGQWAGRVEHLPHGEILRFSTLDALLAYLYRTLDVESNSSSDARDIDARTGGGSKD